MNHTPKMSQFVTPKAGSLGVKGRRAIAVQISTRLTPSRRRIQKSPPGEKGGHVWAETRSCGTVELRGRADSMAMNPVVTSVILDTDLTEYLDQQSLAVRRTSGAALSRSKLLRGIVGGLKAVRMDFSRCRAEPDVAWLVAFVLRAYGDRQ